MSIKLEDRPLTDQTKSVIEQSIRLVDPHAHIEWSKALMGGMWFVSVKSRSDFKSNKELRRKVDEIGKGAGLNFILSSAA